MVLYLNRRQSEQIIIALMETYGSKDLSALEIVDRLNKVLILQCKHDKSHFDKAIKKERKSS